MELRRHGCKVTWLQGYKVTGLQGYMVTWLHYCMVARRGFWRSAAVSKTSRSRLQHYGIERHWFRKSKRSITGFKMSGFAKSGLAAHHPISGPVDQLLGGNAGRAEQSIRELRIAQD